jgi:dTDP-4-dehydrorhamnose 3,5-epimerase
MEVIKTEFEGLIQIIPTVYTDNRGWFFEFFKESAFRELGITEKFMQENISYSRKGVIRGMHFQLTPFEQAKVVSVLSGKVLDAVIDLRSNSPTFGRVYTCLLTAEKHNILMVPAGFAHGFAAMEDSVFIYKTNTEYNPAAEQGIIWNDPSLNIPWPFNNPILSEKDRNLPTFDELLRKSVISRAK